jgi:glycosyltransferase involved in cell wall biosynthesis
MEISVIIPAYNEAENVVPLYKALKVVLDKFTKKYEIIYVDDGSSDGTFNEVETLNKKDKKVKCIKFRRNFGKGAALAAGFEQAKGKLVVTVDADLQDDPEEIPAMINKLNFGYDMVIGWKYHRKDSFSKKFFSKIFNFLVRKLTGVKVHDSDCNFRVMKNQVAKELEVYGGKFRYIPSIAHSKGFKVTEMKVVHHPRLHGTAKFSGYGRLIRGFLDLITIKYFISFDKSPSYFFGKAGLGLLGAGGLAGLYLLYQKYFLGQFISGRPLLLLTVLLLILGIQFIFFGLLGEMITRTSQKQERGYKVAKVL